MRENGFSFWIWRFKRARAARCWERKHSFRFRSDTGMRRKCDNFEAHIRRQSRSSSAKRAENERDIERLLISYLHFDFVQSAFERPASHFILRLGANKLSYSVLESDLVFHEATFSFLFQVLGSFLVSNFCLDLFNYCSWILLLLFFFF